MSRSSKIIRFHALLPVPDFVLFSVFFRQESSFTCPDSIGCVHIAWDEPGCTGVMQTPGRGPAVLGMKQVQAVGHMHLFAETGNTQPIPFSEGE